MLSVTAVFTAVPSQEDWIEEYPSFSPHLLLQACTLTHTHTHKSISRNDYAEERTLSRNCPVSCVCRVFERFRRVISCSVSVLVTSFLLQQSRMTILQRQTAQKAIAKIATFRKTKNKTNAGSNTPWAYARESLQRNVYAQFSYFGAFATTRSPDQKKDTPRSRAETK